nr:MAG: capsid protein [Canine astrovirus]
MPRNRNGRQNRNTTRVVVQSTSGNQQAAAPPRQRRGRRPTVNVNVNTRPQQQAQRQRTNTNVRMRNNGRVRGRQQGASQPIYHKVTTTLGTVGSNTSNDIETEMCTIINPALMREQTGSNNFGPLGVVASQYSLWKIKRIVVRLKPLVGNNAANGTMVRVSYNPSTGAGQSSWSSLGARKHADAAIGQARNFTLTEREVKGPKGGWFFTNTTNDVTSSSGGVINIHSLGKTTNPYTNTPFSGPLFLVEVDTEWEFKDYLQQPGLLQMIKGETSENAKIKVDPATGKIQMEVDRTARLAASATNPGAAEVIWMITDTIIDAGTAAFPPPFNWLFRGGWWFLKKVLNAPVNGTSVTFDVFPSMTDAQNNRYIYSDQSNAAEVNIQTVQYQQVTPGNTGLPSLTFGTRGTAAGQTNYRVDSLHTLYKEGGTWKRVPAQPVWFQKKNYTDSDRGIKFVAGNKRITTYNLFEAGVDAPIPSSGIPVYMQDTAQVQVGLAVAGAHADLAATRQIHLTSILFYATQSRTFTYNSSNDGVFYRAQLTQDAYVQRFTRGSNEITELRMVVEQGKWYVAQFLSDGEWIEAFIIGGVPAYKPRDAWTATPQTSDIDSTQGDINGGFPLGYMARLHVSPFQQADITVETPTTFAERYVDALPDFDQDPSDEEDSPTNEEDTLYFDEPPVEVLQVEPEVEGMYNMLVANGATHRQAALAVNQIKPSKTYEDFVAKYHDSLVDGFSPAQARANALGQQPETY